MVSLSDCKRARLLISELPSILTMLLEIEDGAVQVCDEKLVVLTGDADSFRA